MRKHLTVRPGMEIGLAQLTARLFGAGYPRRSQVDGPGQFSVRGGIVDLYAPDMEKPCRLEFWGDEVDTIHTFDLVSQRREDPVEKIHLSPAREVLFGDAAGAAALLRQAAGRAKGRAARQLEAAMEDDLALLDGGALPTAMDKYLAVRYENPPPCWNTCRTRCCFSASPAPSGRAPGRWRQGSARR